jgi:hypothetical protein
MSMSTRLGTGWPTVTWTDGGTTGRLDARPPLVTGPNTMVQIVSPRSRAVPSRFRPTRSIPSNASQTRYGSYIPPEVTAIVTGKFPRAALHVNINPDAVR